jgi:hypothetical protein
MNALTKVVLRWRPPRHIRELSDEQHRRLREKYNIIVEGESIPPPIPSFVVNLVAHFLTSVPNLDCLGHENPGANAQALEIKRDCYAYSDSATRNTNSVRILP